MSPRHVLIITPIFFGDGTGAGVYYKLLIKILASKNIDITVVSEKANSKEISDFDRLTYYSLFPTRTGKRKQMVFDAIKHAWQNLTYLFLPFILQKNKLDCVLVHSSFYTLPSIFPILFNWLIKNNPDIHYVVDVRDRLIPPKKAPWLSSYDSVIACSKNVLNYLVDCSIPREKISYIPVPQEKLSVGKEDVNDLLLKFGLEDTSYLFYAGLIKELKGVDLLIDAFSHFVLPEFPHLKLVLAGFIKTTRRDLLNSLKLPQVVHVGNLSRYEVMCLMAGAKLCVNLSLNEGLPRFSLEAIALKCPVLLPPNIPEFSQFCPDFVVESRQPKEIGQKIIEVLNSRSIPHYPIDQHLPEQIISKYEEILDHLDKQGKHSLP